MPRERTYLLGERYEKPYFLVIRGAPDFEEAEEFAVVIYYNDPVTQQRVEIARIDTSHGFTHFDRLYRRDRSKEPVDFDLWEAVDRLDANWRRYAERYEHAHDE